MNLDGTLSRRSDGQAEIVSLHGRIEADIAPALRKELISMIDSGRSRVVMDLAQVDFIDSSGLSLLITSLKKAAECGGDVVLLGASDAVKSLLNLTHLHKVFRIYDSQEAAVASL